jgi:membrane protease YdiL (CAAX protease family)
MTDSSLTANLQLTQRSAWTRAVGAVAVLLLVNIAALELMMLVSTLAHWSSDVHTRAEVTIGSAIIGEIVFLVLLTWWLRREHLTLDDLGLRKRPKAWAVLAAVAFAVVYALLTATNPGFRPNLGLHDFLKAEAVVAVVAAVVAGIVEEIVSRGYFMVVLQRARVSV